MQYKKPVKTYFLLLSVIIAASVTRLLVVSASASDRILASEAHKECVILLHGMARTVRSMKSLQQSLSAAGYFTVNDGYPSTSQTITDSIKNLPASLAKCGDNPARIHVVTHSLGGIMIRQYLQTEQLPAGSRIVMLSPPNKGSELADKFKHWWFFKKVNGPAGQELGTDIFSTPNNLKPVKAEIGIITGRSSIEPWFSWMIPGEDDGKVSVASAQLEEMKDFLVVDENHTFIMNSHEVAEQVIYFLKNGRFQTVEIETLIK